MTRQWNVDGVANYSQDDGIEAEEKKKKKMKTAFHSAALFRPKKLLGLPDGCNLNLPNMEEY
jgi:hypothetical protein